MTTTQLCIDASPADTLQALTQVCLETLRAPLTPMPLSAWPVPTEDLNQPGVPLTVRDTTLVLVVHRLQATLTTAGGLL